IVRSRSYPKPAHHYVRITPERCSETVPHMAVLDRVRERAGVSPPASLVLDCRELHKRFGELEAVRGVSFAIAEGETYGLLGPNGAGKTTTISMVCGLLEPDSGEVFVSGQRLTSHSVAEKAAIGYVPQELAIYPDLSARENLQFFARLY